jgi:hypothetical protein
VSIGGTVAEQHFGNLALHITVHAVCSHPEVAEGVSRLECWPSPERNMLRLLLRQTKHSDSGTNGLLVLVLVR